MAQEPSLNLKEPDLQREAAISTADVIIAAADFRGRVPRPLNELLDAEIEERSTN